MIKKYSFFTGWWHLLLQQHIYPYYTAYTCQTEILDFNTRPRINNILSWILFSSYLTLNILYYF
ncbi:hypothetical protein Bca4012_074275 [Brassica carinata]